jgi:hypothetical protein
MPNQEHLDILAKGVKVWNAWRWENSNVCPDLDHAHLMGTKLGNADLEEADLRGANLRFADLSGANLTGADLSGASLACANVRRAKLSFAKLSQGLEITDIRDDGVYLKEPPISTDLSNADLSGADLNGADLSYAHLIDADLTGVNLSGARYGGTYFINLDLSVVLGLDDAEHHFASSIDMATIYRSKGKIPESFLRGCGVPENFITYMHSLTGAAFEFYSCFISYSTKDQAFAERLHADLQARGVRCWFAPHDIQGGRKVHEQIDEAIRVYDKLLLILSDASMNSNWVKTEIANARAREQQNRQMLFPITLVPFGRIKEWKLFDADTGIDSAREIREYFIPDFSNWKDHDSYTVAFERLVRDLKSPGEKAEAQPAL